MTGYKSRVYDYDELRRDMLSHLPLKDLEVPRTETIRRSIALNQGINRLHERAKKLQMDIAEAIKEAREVNRDDKSFKSTSDDETESSDKEGAKDTAPPSITTLDAANVDSKGKSTPRKATKATGAPGSATKKSTRKKSRKTGCKNCLPNRPSDATSVGNAVHQGGNESGYVSTGRMEIESRHLLPKSGRTVVRTQELETKGNNLQGHIAAFKKCFCA